MKTAFYEQIALQGWRMSALGFVLLLTRAWGVAESPSDGLIVLPVEVAPLAVTIGQTQSVPDITLTVQNPGPGALRWTASVDADWIALSAKSGLLLPGEQQATVVVHVGDVSRFGVGQYLAHVVFLSPKQRLAPVSRTIVLNVRLPAPILGPVPPFTDSTTNTISWTRVPGANQYEAQASMTPGFASFVSSGWLSYPSTNYTFSNLQDSVTYFYRVRCRSNYVAWGQTLAKEFAQNQNSNVTTVTSPGDIVLAGNTNRLWFENFDEPGTSWADTLFTDSSYAPPDPGYGRGPLDETTRAPNTEPPLPINQGDDKVGYLVQARFADRYAYVRNTPENQIRDVTVDAYIGGSVSALWIEPGIVLRGDPRATTIFPGGNGYYANVVMSGDSCHWLRFGWIAGSIVYHFLPSPDVSFPIESPDENYHLRLSARGTDLTASLWQVVSTNGIIRESPVHFFGNGTNIVTASDSRYTVGVVGLTGVDASAYDGDYAFFKDITIQTHEFPSSYAGAGSSTATVAPPNWLDRWGQLLFTAASPPGTALRVDVLDGDGVVLAADVPSPTDLDSLPAVASHRTMQLRANLFTSDSSQTPVLSDWSITFPQTTNNPSESDWTPVVASTPDTDPPVLVVTSPEDGFVTSTNLVTFNGTAIDAVSGVSSVRVQVVTATTTNGFTNWTLKLTLGSVGTNFLAVIAKDNARPVPNPTHVSRRIVYRP